jgi:mono/diheme cytochrome c family protein
MNWKLTSVLLTTLLLLSGLALTYGQSLSQASQIKTPPNEERERLLAIGNKIFVERCAKCHNERGDKPLPSGPPLNERKLTDEEIARTVAGRLKDSPDEQKRAVALYISSFMKRK